LRISSLVGPGLEKNGTITRLLVSRMVRDAPQELGVQIRELFGKVGTYHPVRENFRLTPEVKAKFTEKLEADLTEPRKEKMWNRFAVAAEKFVMS